MKKTLAIILALMLSLASVSFSLAETVEPAPLTWWCISSQSDFYNARAAAWNEQNPDRPIALETVDMAGSDRQTKLLVALQTGEGAPDYCDVNITAFGTFFDYEEIPFLTLTDLVADERDVYVQAKLDIYSTGGELYGAPSQLGGTVVYYNTDITEAAGVDIDSIVTWDDYVAAGKQVLEKTGKPMTVIETTDIVQSLLADERVESSLTVVSGMRSTASIALSIPGRDKSAIHLRGAAQSFGAGDFTAEAFHDTGLFHFGYPLTMPGLYRREGEGLVQMLEQAKAAGAVASVDTCLPDLKAEPGQVDWQPILKRALPHVDLILPSLEEAPYMTDREQYIRRIKIHRITSQRKADRYHFRLKNAIGHRKLNAS